MQIKVDQLAAHLRKGLSPVYLLSGDEPLQMLEAADQIRLQAIQEGAERSVLTVDKGFDWGQLLQEGASLSLFSGLRLIELRMGHYSPGKPGAEVLVEYAGNPPPDTTLLISMNRVDKRTQQGRWFKALDKAGAVIQIWPVEPSRLPGWIIQRMQQLGKRMDKDAAELIAQRTEGNLLAAKQELGKLCLLINKDSVSLEDIQGSVIDSTRHDVFTLIEYALTGNTARIAGMLRGLQQEGVEPIGIHGAVMWEMRRLCSISARITDGTPKDKVFAEYRLWNPRQKAVNAVLNRFNNHQLNRLLTGSVVLDKALKGAVRQNPWELLENFLFRIAGSGVQSPR